MKRALLLCCLIACKKPAPPPAVIDAGLPITAVSVAPIASVAPPPIVDAGPPMPPTSFALAGAGKAGVIWLMATPNRVWLSLRGSDAVADGDGPLVKTKDPLTGLPYEPASHVIAIAGEAPHLFALRTKKQGVRGNPLEPTIFVQQPDGSWKQGAPLKNDWNYPVGFIGFRDGALMVTSTISNGAPSKQPGERGTTLRFIAPDGTSSDPKLPIHEDFLAWDVDVEGETLALLGTVWVKDHAPGIQLLRVNGNQSRITAITHANLDSMIAYRTKVVEFGDRALVMPESAVEDEAIGWKPNGRTLFIVDNAGKISGRLLPPYSDVPVVKGGQLVGDDLFVVANGDVVHIDPKGKANKIALPPIERVQCNASDIFARGAELWVTADCDDERTAVYRSGPAKGEPLQW